MTTPNLNPFLQPDGRTASSRRINNAFEQLLESHINIPTTLRSEASTSQKHIREFLQSENQRDTTFPKILKNNDSDFISGSFGRHTKTWPLDDIDLFFPLEGGGLFYWRGGVLTQNTVVTDGGITFNPLLGQRWGNGNRISSDRLISEFRDVLGRRYAQSDVSIDGQAISVQLTIGASSECDGLKFDVVPCFRLDPHDGSASFYLIPDGSDGWRHTNPRLDEATCAKLQDFHNGLYRKIVKIVKYWNDSQLNNALNSYYVELSIANYFSLMYSIGRRISALSEGVAIAFSALRAARLAGDIPSPVVYAPLVELGALTTSQEQKLMNAFTSSAAAVAYENAGRADQAVSVWKGIFGSQFAD